MKVLVVGATGSLGLDVCRLALEVGHEVAGVFRGSSDPGRVAALRELGVELRQADLRDEATIRAALAGIDAVVSTATVIHARVEGETLDDVDRDGQLRLLRAAADAGVRHFVYVSFSGNIVRDAALTRAKRSVEDALRASGLTYTILRPTLFMEVWLSPALGFDFPNGRATVFGDGRQGISWIAREDVARFAVRALEREAARNATLELGGPEALSPLDVARIFEKEGGRPFEVQQVPGPALEAQYGAAQEPRQQSLAALVLAYAAGDAIPMEATAAAYDVQLRPVRSYAREVMATARETAAPPPTA